MLPVKSSDGNFKLKFKSVIKFLYSIISVVLCQSHKKYALLIVVGVSFNQSSYSINEASSQGQVFLLLTSPLLFDVTAIVEDSRVWYYNYYHHATSENYYVCMYGI